MSFAANEAKKNPTVLIIDDDPGILGLQKLRLKKTLDVNVKAIIAGGDKQDVAGSSFDYAIDSPEEAKKIIDEVNPDVVISDFNMETFNGAQFLQVVSQNTQKRDVKMAIFSGNDSSDIEKELNSVGLGDKQISIFSKPDPKALQQWLNEALGRDAGFTSPG